MISTNSVKKLLKIEMLKRDISTEDLHNLLAQKGYNYTLPSINNKISRGTFSATFLIQCFESMGINNININEVENK